MDMDTWDRTEAALRAVRRLMWHLHDAKPPKEDRTATAAWEAEAQEARHWAVQIHNRRIDLNIQRQRTTHQGTIRTLDSNHS